MNCISRPAKADDLSDISRLFDSQFAVDYNSKLFKWKYLKDHDLFSCSSVLESEGEIVGFLGQVPTRLFVSGKELIAMHGADLFIKEEFRRIDNFLKLLSSSVLEMRRHGIGIAFGFANSQADALSASILGRSSSVPVPLLVRPVGASLRGVPKPFKSTAKIIFAIIDHIDNISLPRQSKKNSLLLKKIDFFDERFDVLWEKVKNNYPVIVVRNASALNRRYVETPAAKYKIFCVENSKTGQINGYMVLSIRRKGNVFRGQITDLLTVRGGREGGFMTARILVQQAVSWLKEQYVDVIEAWALKQSHIRTAFLRSGFVPRSNVKTFFNISNLSNDQTDAVKSAFCADNWFLSFGDSDAS